MQQENSKKPLALLFWSLTVICMALIFYFSSQTAEESAAQSGGILSFLISVFGENSLTDFILRKSAHFIEFGGLCFLFNCSLYFSFGKAKYIPSVIFTSLYALSDEIHQIFVDGRSCELRDWAIDTSGAVLGAVAFILLYIIIMKIKKKR